MLFRDLAIYVAEAAALPKPRSSDDFLRATYHVRESYLYYLLRALENAHFLPDAAKLNVHFGPDQNPAQYSCCLGVAEFWRNDFDFQAFFQMTPEEQDDHILECLGNTFTAVTRQQEVSDEPVRRALANARSEGLFVRYAVRKLSKLHPCKRLKFNVIRSIERGGESWSLEVCDRAGHVLESFTMIERTNRIAAGGAYRKARWRGDLFLIADAGGRTTFQKSTNRLVSKYVK